jgi:hypothetical protein
LIFFLPRSEEKSCWEEKEAAEASSVRGGDGDGDGDGGDVGKEKEEKRAHSLSLSSLSLSTKKKTQASGLVHELEMFYVLPGFSSYTGCWMLFFSGWGAILGLEKGLKIAAECVSGSRLWRKSKLPPLSLPRWLATPLVVASSVAYANLLFLPPAVDQGIAARVMASASWVLKALLRLDLE